MARKQPAVIITHKSLPFESFTSEVEALRARKVWYDHRINEFNIVDKRHQTASRRTVINNMITLRADIEKLLAGIALKEFRTV